MKPMKQKLLEIIVSLVSVLKFVLDDANSELNPETVEIIESAIEKAENLEV